LGEEIGLNPQLHPIFLEPEPASKAEPKKKTKHYRKRGRQRNKEKVKRLFIIWRIVRGYWPSDLDYEMCLYYTIHYIRKDGKFHDIFLQWKAEAETISGKKFRINPAIQPVVSQSRSKVLYFPQDRIAGQS
jgi:hypothetical protein